MLWTIVVIEAVLLCTCAALGLWIAFRWRQAEPLTRDADGRWISPAGRAYAVTVEPVVGQLVLRVELHGGETIPNTWVPTMSAHVRPAPLAVERAIRKMLGDADRAEAEFSAVRTVHGWDDAPAATGFERAPTPEELLEAVEELEAERQDR